MSSQSHLVKGPEKNLTGIIISPHARHQWLTLVILATWEAEVRRITL
jgi:hypothetical protein